MKIVHVVGARPNFMKIAPILAAIRQHNKPGSDPTFDSLLVHTGQHDDQAMSQSFFEDLDLPRPDLNLEVDSGSHAEQTGKVMIDTLFKHRERASRSLVLETLGLKEEQQVKPYGVLTLHRPSNVDCFDTLHEILQAVKTLSDVVPIIFPCHPRTVSQIESFGLQSYFGKSIQNGDRIVLVPPFGYLDFLQLHAHAKIVLTDSGGIQEEATILGVPCLTLRENTERPITVLQGTNRLVGTRRDSILKGFEAVMEERGGLGRVPEKWDGWAAERIVGVLAETGKLIRSDGRRLIETHSR